MGRIVISTCRIKTDFSRKVEVDEVDGTVEDITETEGTVEEPTPLKVDER